ncbi:uncharacterized protein LOC123667798 [Melitaea cinxia]|uniref:uncharacterized protein LOC123667798 n=1 Tax=Melitaea cinxia TaxID=113334 RepID=UPI001E27426F|nr:uncharacterized protein LOC123667798 [Melitaea cinxia]
MSASSVSRGSPAAAADIIDLDRYIRASVRPSRHRPAHTRERLIVDAGGVDRVPVELSSSSDSVPVQPRPYTRDRKQYSHDSGVSDGSYLRQRYRPHRRISVEKPRISSRTADSNSSVREFKAACEKALREQQEQIARVAELCEKLAQPQIAQNIPQTGIQNTPNVGQNIGSNISSQVAQTLNCMSQNTNQFGQHLNPTKQNFGQNVCQVSRVKQRITPCTSDITSSSCSSRNVKIRDKHRSDSCKTYKLIMGKLDELSQLFATRRAPVRARVVRGSSGSISVCDKLVATDDGSNFNTIIHANRNGPGQTSDNSPNRRQLRVIQAHRVDITPADQRRKQLDNIEAHCSGPSVTGSASDVFDLDNPLHLYAQAKRLQALHASSQRSSNRSPYKHGVYQEKSDDKSEDGIKEKCDDRNKSVCALCRSYWKILRQYFRQ